MIRKAFARFRKKSQSYKLPDLGNMHYFQRFLFAEKYSENSFKFTDTDLLMSCFTT